MKTAEKCNPPLADSELDKIWHSATKFGTKVSGQDGYIDPKVYNSDCVLKPEDFSDVGQATVLAREYKGKLRFSPATDYMVYNGSFWEETAPKSQGISQELTERQMEGLLNSARTSAEETEKPSFCGSITRTRL